MKTQKTHLFFLICAATVCLFGTDPVLANPDESADPLTLRLRLKEGEIIKQQLSILQEISQSVGRMKQDSRESMRLGLIQTVKDVADDGTLLIHAEFDTIRAKTEATMGSSTYDSASDSNQHSTQTMLFDSMIASTLEMIVSPTGTIQQLQGADQMLDKLFEALPAPPGDLRDMMEKQIKQQFGDEALKALFAPSMSIFPDKPVRNGHSWTRKLDVPGAYAHTQTNTYRLVGRKDGVASIVLKSDLSPLKNAPPMIVGIMEMQLELGGTQTGKLKVDEKTGLVLSASVNQKLSGKAVMKGIPNSGDIEAPMTITSRITLTTEK